MNTTFYLNIGGLTNELSAMQPRGHYWLCSAASDNTFAVTQQLLTYHAQSAKTHLIRMIDHKRQDDDLFLLHESLQSDVVSYTVPESIKAFKKLFRDIQRYHISKNSLIILILPAEIPLRLESDAMSYWISEANRYLTDHNSALLVICDGALSLVCEKNFLAYHRLLDGLVSIPNATLHKTYNIRWWANEHGIVAEKVFELVTDTQTGNITAKASTFNSSVLQTSNDTHLFYATERVLEGAPPLSDYWHLYPNNELLAVGLTTANAATAIFSLDNSQTIPELANLLHQLRMSRGNALKIVVRELEPCLRYNDEYALFACGANLIVPHGDSLSSFLTKLEGIQGTLFQRALTNNVSELLENLRPIKYKGRVEVEQFYNEIMRYIKRPHDTGGREGVLIALTPVVSLNVEQAFTLCHFRRSGDLALLMQDQLFLFLSACRIHDVDTVLNHIFQLPVEEVFINKTLWHSERDILNELTVLQTRYQPFKNNLSITDKTKLENLKTNQQNTSDHSQMSTVNEPLKFPKATHLILTKEVFES